MVVIQSLIQKSTWPNSQAANDAFKTLGDRPGLVAAAALHAPQPTLPARGINGEVGWARRTFVYGGMSTALGRPPRPEISLAQNP